MTKLHDADRGRRSRACGTNDSARGPRKCDVHERRSRSDAHRSIPAFYALTHRAQATTAWRNRLSRFRNDQVGYFKGFYQVKAIEMLVRRILTH